ncbi:UNKNOWN [Stylonychia lemnae]|uniref:Uncharacterized protein n=1 Tax=Stylonychia lemnae TaxID=5949 RepID=A0A077ZP52_STYLE|nr:UNKNOWN [Stylonychia lemnae]|eukprot:CDW71165.1 UNKNOWN [Stylonychia lemnae]
MNRQHSIQKTHLIQTSKVIHQVVMNVMKVFSNMSLIRPTFIILILTSNITQQQKYVYQIAVLQVVNWQTIHIQESVNFQVFIANTEIFQMVVGNAVFRITNAGIISMFNNTAVTPSSYIQGSAFQFCASCSDQSLQSVNTDQSFFQQCGYNKQGAMCQASNSLSIHNKCFKCKDTYIASKMGMGYECEACWSYYNLNSSSQTLEEDIYSNSYTCNQSFLKKMKFRLFRSNLPSSVCQQGYSLSGGTCVLNCPIGQFSLLESDLNYQLKTATCSQCSTNCLSCLSSESTQCTKCTGGYYLGIVNVIQQSGECLVKQESTESITLYLTSTRDTSEELVITTSSTKTTFDNLPEAINRAYEIAAPYKGMTITIQLADASYGIFRKDLKKVFYNAFAKDYVDPQFTLKIVSTRADKSIIYNKVGGSFQILVPEALEFNNIIVNGLDSIFPCIQKQQQIQKYSINFCGDTMLRKSRTICPLRISNGLFVMRAHINSLSQSSKITISLGSLIKTPSNKPYHIEITGTTFSSFQTCGAIISNTFYDEIDIVINSTVAKYYPTINTYAQQKIIWTNEARNVYDKDYNTFDPTDSAFNSIIIMANNDFKYMNTLKNNYQDIYLTLKHTRYVGTIISLNQYKGRLYLQNNKFQNLKERLVTCNSNWTLLYPETKYDYVALDTEDDSDQNTKFPKYRYLQLKNLVSLTDYKGKLIVIKDNTFSNTFHSGPAIRIQGYQDQIDFQILIRGNTFTNMIGVVRTSVIHIEKHQLMDTDIKAEKALKCSGGIEISENKFKSITGCEMVDSTLILLACRNLYYDVYPNVDSTNYKTYTVLYDQFGTNMESFPTNLQNIQEDLRILAQQSTALKTIQYYDEATKQLSIDYQINIYKIVLNLNNYQECTKGVTYLDNQGQNQYWYNGNLINLLGITDVLIEQEYFLNIGDHTQENLDLIADQAGIRRLSTSKILLVSNTANNYFFS